MAPSAFILSSAGNTALHIRSWSMLSSVLPRGELICKRLAMRYTSVVWLVPAAWNTAGLKNTASPFFKANCVRCSAKYSLNSGRRQAR